MDLTELIKHMNVQNMLFEAAAFDEDRAEFLNETLLYGMKTVPKEFLSESTPQEAASLVMAVVSQMLYEDEISDCTKALEYFFKEDD